VPLRTGGRRRKASLLQTGNNKSGGTDDHNENLHASVQVRHTSHLEKIVWFSASWEVLIDLSPQKFER